MLGARIAMLRQCAGMSQTELAKRLMISPSTVGMYEQGRREPALNVLVEIANVFDVSLDFLVTGRAGCDREEIMLTEALDARIQVVDTRLNKRRSRPFSRQELAVLMAAMLMEP